MNCEEVTILTLKDWEKVELPVTIENYIQMEKELKANKEPWIFIQHLRREINFYNIMDKRWKTKYLALPAPEKHKTLLLMWSWEKEEFRKNDPDSYYRMEREEEENRKNIKVIIAEQRKNWEERRKKNFIVNRRIILRDLAVKERLFWIQTTESKLTELDQFRKVEIKKSIIN